MTQSEKINGHRNKREQRAKGSAIEPGAGTCGSRGSRACTYLENARRCTRGSHARRAGGASCPETARLRSTYISLIQGSPRPQLTLYLDVQGNDTGNELELHWVFYASLIFSTSIFIFFFLSLFFFFFHP